MVLLGVGALLSHVTRGVGQGGGEASTAATAEAATTPVVASPAAGSGGSSAPSAAPLATYAPDHIVAYVGGETYSYAQLKAAVRVARVLGHFSGDAVPSDTSPELPAYEVRMLRRQIDLLLFKQAMARGQVAAPTAEPSMLVQQYMNDVNADEAQLAALMETNGVTEADLEAWFVQARAVDYMVNTVLMAGRDASERDRVVSSWLDEQWSIQSPFVDFYDPDLVLPLSTPTAPVSLASPTPGT